ncbi:MAG: hypothetical protein AAFY88_29925, partial [Acidobacteriota bacterium]
MSVASLFRFRELGALVFQLGAVYIPAALAVVVALAAGWGQLRWGRLSRRRVHGVLSLALLVVVGGSAAALDRLADRLERIEVAEADFLLDLIPARRGTWSVATGVDAATGAALASAVDVASGREKKLGARLRLTQKPIFSEDGGTLFFWRCPAVLAPIRVVSKDGDLRERLRCHFFYLDLQSSDLTERVIPLEYEELKSHRMALAPDGSKIAILHRSTVLVVERSGRLLWRRQLPPLDGPLANWARLRFDGSAVQVVRVRLREDAPKGEASSSAIIDGVVSTVAPHVTEVWRLVGDGEPSLEAVIPWTPTIGSHPVDPRFIASMIGQDMALFEWTGRQAHRIDGDFVRDWRATAGGRLVALRSRAF